MVAAAKLYTLLGNLCFGEDGFPITWVPFFSPARGYSVSNSCIYALVISLHLVLSDIRVPVTVEPTTLCRLYHSSPYSLSLQGRRELSS